MVGEGQDPPLRFLWNLLLFLKNQFVVAGFRVMFCVEPDTGQFCDDQFAGGVDDTSRTEVTTDGGEIFFG